MDEEKAKKKAQGSMWETGGYDTRKISHDGRVPATSALGSIAVFTDPRLQAISSGDDIERSAVMQEKRAAIAARDKANEELAAKSLRICDTCTEVKSFADFQGGKHRCRACWSKNDQLRFKLNKLAKVLKSK